MTPTPTRRTTRFEFPPLPGSAGPMFETRICILRRGTTAGAIAAQRLVLRHYFPDEQIPRMVRAILAGGRAAPMFEYEIEDERHHVLRTPLDMRMSRGMPTKVVYYLDIPNWYFVDDDFPLTLRHADSEGQFRGLRAIDSPRGKTRAIRVQNLNTVNRDHEVILNLYVEQTTAGRVQSTILKLRPLIRNAA